MWSSSAATRWAQRQFRRRRRYSRGMVLSRPDILKRIAQGDLRFAPPVAETSIEQVTIDLRLGHIFTHFKPPPNMAAVRVTRELFKDKSYWQDTHATEQYFLQKHEFVI